MKGDKFMTKKKRHEITKANQYVTNLQVENVLDALKDTTDNDSTAPMDLNTKNKIQNKNY
jgi:hypothetical protein